MCAFNARGPINRETRHANSLRAVYVRQRVDGKWIGHDQARHSVMMEQYGSWLLKESSDGTLYWDEQTWNLPSDESRKRSRIDG